MCARGHGDTGTRAKKTCPFVHGVLLVTVTEKLLSDIRAVRHEPTPWGERGLSSSFSLLPPQNPEAPTVMTARERSAERSRTLGVTEVNCWEQTRAPVQAPWLALH